MKTGIKIKGIIKFIVKHQDGTEDVYVVKNLVTTLGLISLAELLANNSLTTPYSHLAIGDGTTAPTAGDTTLENELLRSAATVSQMPNPDDTKVQYQTTWGTGAATGSYTEAGIFNSDTAGNMFNRAVYPQVDVGATDALVVQWTIDFQNV